ncbi:unnamed protein product [Acanthoscelides obtectus]|uniref:Uncharacterized protein n=1 Tax=Acanthoscelides obtectus TaxID=200917 RepID=A0A9P0P622_ACAOB|nr:unnamed protein product [Acanthoscelides obtectus]CAK1658230.1 hypothetical protein AOBTE_LOCUS20772 [Acanthoscelides obtectus]
MWMPKLSWFLETHFLKVTGSFSNVHHKKTYIDILKLTQGTMC